MPASSQEGPAAKTEGGTVVICCRTTLSCVRTDCSRTGKRPVTQCLRDSVTSVLKLRRLPYSVLQAWRAGCSCCRRGFACDGAMPEYIVGGESCDDILRMVKSDFQLDRQEHRTLDQTLAMEDRK